MNSLCLSFGCSIGWIITRHNGCCVRTDRRDSEIGISWVEPSDFQAISIEIKIKDLTLQFSIWRNVNLSEMNFSYKCYCGCCFCFCCYCCGCGCGLGFRCGCLTRLEFANVWLVFVCLFMFSFLNHKANSNKLPSCLYEKKRKIYTNTHTHSCIPHFCLFV